MPRKKSTRKRRVLSGLGAARKRKTSKRGCKRVSRKAATRRGKGGRRVLKKGCRYNKGDGATCCPPGSRKTKRKRKTSKRKTAKRKTAKKKTGRVYSARSPLPFKKGKGGRKVLKKGCRRITSGADKGKIRCKRKMTRRKRAA